MAPDRTSISPPTGISTRLLVLSIAIQIVDIVIMVVAIRRGLFSFGPGPVGRLVGLGPATIWLIFKTSGFAVLILAVFRGRRWLILLLNAWFAAFIVFNIAILSR
jgi:hypothetical protein